MAIFVIFVVLLSENKYDDDDEPQYVTDDRRTQHCSISVTVSTVS